MKKIPVALQLYTVRDAAQDDFFGVLAQVKAMGYDYVEFIADFYGHTAQEIRAELDRLDLKGICAHVPIDLFIEKLDETIADFKTLGCEYLAVPWLDEARRPGQPGYAPVVPAIERAGRACREAGITLLYHNHDFEFVKLDGEYALDVLFNAISPEYLQTEIDTCWVNVAGENPAAYVRKYTGRAPVVHLKDFVKQGFVRPAHLGVLVDAENDEIQRDGGFDLRPLGYGVQDIPSILEAAADAGAHYVVVEQDRSVQRPSLEAARLSREYLKSLGL